MTSTIRVEPGDDGHRNFILPYSVKRVEKIKTMPGRQWNSQRSYWTIPNAPGITSRLTLLFGEDRADVAPRTKTEALTPTPTLSPETWPAAHPLGSRHLE